MAQTRKKRRRKHRGTQGGRVDPSRRAGRPRSREEAKARARASRGKRPASRLDAPPTWRSAVVRAVVAAAIFTLLLVLLFGRPLGAALGLGALMLVFYVPAGYYMDTMLWRRRERARIRAQEEK
ncbi:MAG TPA: hypothetical protein VFY04_06780 [Solirubrobacterales bacterium]|nr:hypothetical protein [Solirubrobacterales bacterium]